MIDDGRESDGVADAESGSGGGKVPGGMEAVAACPPSSRYSGEVMYSGKMRVILCRVFRARSAHVP